MQRHRMGSFSQNHNGSLTLNILGRHLSCARGLKNKRKGQKPRAELLAWTPTKASKWQQSEPTSSGSPAETRRQQRGAEQREGSGLGHATVRRSVRAPRLSVSDEEVLTLTQGSTDSFEYIYMYI